MNTAIIYAILFMCILFIGDFIHLFKNSLTKNVDNRVKRDIIIFIVGIVILITALCLNPDGWK